MTEEEKVPMSAPPVVIDKEVTLTDALHKVNDLHKLSLTDGQPCIEALSLPVQYQANFDTNFEDKDAFVSGVAKYKEEAKVHADLVSWKSATVLETVADQCTELKKNKLLEEGQEYAVMVYTWRCCSRAIPQIKSNDQPNRKEIYEQVVDILEPHISKLKRFMHFQDRAITTFSGEVKRLCHAEKRNDFVSEAYLLTLGKFINMFVELDELKNMKASIRNDHAHYRRASQFLQVVVNESALQESQNLSMFLATTNTIRDSLKKALLTIQGYEDLLAEVVNICVHMYENKMYLEPQEKAMLVKVISLGLFMMDNKEISIYKMDQRRKINISKMDKILKQLEIVPLYGDMQIKPYQYITSSLNFDRSRWPHCESSQSSSQSNFLLHLSGIRDEHLVYLSQLASHLSGTISKSAVNYKRLYDIALKGLHLLSTWTQRVIELYSWKLLNPTDMHQNDKCPESAEAYEKATRYNYSDEEKFALVEVIGMIKGLQRAMLRAEGVLQSAIKRHMYRELQQFVQLILREPLRRSVRKKHDTIKVLFMSVRNTCADWIQGFEPKNDPAMQGKKDPPDGFTIELPRKSAGPSSTQLYMVRTMLESVLTEKSGSAKKSFRKDIDTQHLRIIETFHKNSFFWKYMLNLNECIHNICDLSQLWYREFYLELTMGERIQFPIEMSMPWILTDNILEKRESSMTEYLLYPLDLYNDSAVCALTRFHQQYLYDEVEAEVNLCFDQLVYKLSDQIFAHYKSMAGHIMLGGDSPCFEINNNNPCTNRYATLLKQRHVQILGRSIDLNKLICQRISASLQKSLDVAISIFDSRDITGIVELEALIMVNKLTHHFLSKYLTLDDFDSMVKEANHNVTAPYGRITLHVFWELNYDFLPCYCYNASTNRFVKYEGLIPLCLPCERDKPPKPSSPAYVWGTEDLAKIYNSIYSQYKGFVGMDHFRAICRLCGYQGVAVVLQELLKIVSEQLNGQMKKYVTLLMKVMPPKIQPPHYVFKSPDVLEYYQKLLKDVIQYPDLKMEVFQIFREVGNAMLFCLLLEQAMTQEEVCDLKQAGPFQNSIPKPYISVKDGDTHQTKEEELKAIMKKLEAKYSAINIVPLVEKVGNTEQSDTSKEGDLLSRERLCCGLSMFGTILTKIKQFLEDPVWRGGPPANGVMNIDECTEFHRLWSAIQFVFCIPVGANEYTIEELFGEGLNWAGCALVVLLGQQRRFETLDFSNQLLRVNRVDMKTDIVNGIALTAMVSRIRRFQFLNNQIFAVLNRYIPQSETVVEIKHFEPPSLIKESQEKQSDSTKETILIAQV